MKTIALFDYDATVQVTLVQEELGQVCALIRSREAPDVSVSGFRDEREARSFCDFADFTPGPGNIAVAIGGMTHLRWTPR